MEIGSWVKNPSDVKCKRFKGIAVENIWKNKKSGAIIVQYMTKTTTSNCSAEVYQNPETYESSLRKLSKTILRKKGEVEIKVVEVTSGNTISKTNTKNKTKQNIEEYMRRNPDGGSDENFYNEKTGNSMGRHNRKP